MNFQLSQEQDMLVDAVRSFVAKELLPREEAVDRADEVSPQLAAQIRDKAIAAGFYAFNMPEEVGGGGLDYLSQALIERELSKVSWALHVFVARPSKILMACTGAQIDEYLLPCVQGTKIDCFALTEPGAGSDANAIKTRAVRSGDDFVLNGSKHFISHAGHADFAIVFAVTDTYEHNGRQRNAVTSFLVDRDTPGMTIRRGPKCVSNRGYHTYEMFFDDCRVPASKVLGEVGKGWDVANAWLTAGRVMVAANCVGQAQRALDVSLQWAADRKQFGQPIGTYQGVSFKLADMATELVAARQMVRLAASKLDAGARDASTYCAMAKRFATDAGFMVCNEALQLHGGYGYMMEYPIAQYFTDSRVQMIYAGSNEIMKELISRSL